MTLNVFLVDAFLHHRLRAFIMGSGAFLMNGFLMLAYLQYYRSMLADRAAPDAPAGGGNAGASGMATLRMVWGILCAALGAVMIGWLIVLIVQHFTS